MALIGARSRHEQIEAPIEAFLNLLHAQDVYTRTGQFDCQGDTIEVTTDRSDARGVVRRHVKVGQDVPRSFDKQPNGIDLSDFVD